jgi:hypothetical protein
LISANGSGPVVAVHDPAPDAGLKSAALLRIVVPFRPPVTRTRPSASTVAVVSVASGVQISGAGPGPWVGE